jgi:hypothetical protein
VKKYESEDGKNDVKKANGDDSSEDEDDEEGV